MSNFADIRRSIDKLVAQMGRSDRHAVPRHFDLGRKLFLAAAEYAADNGRSPSRFERDAWVGGSTRRYRAQKVFNYFGACRAKMLAYKGTLEELLKLARTRGAAADKAGGSAANGENAAKKLIEAVGAEAAVRLLIEKFWSVDAAFELVRQMLLECGDSLPRSNAPLAATRFGNAAEAPGKVTSREAAAATPHLRRLGLACLPDSSHDALENADEATHSEAPPPGVRFGHPAKLSRVGATAHSAARLPRPRVSDSAGVPNGRTPPLRPDHSAAMPKRARLATKGKRKRPAAANAEKTATDSTNS